MTKHTEIMSEVVHNAKPTLRNTLDRRIKVQQHRYERRKVREYLRLADRLDEE